MSGIGTRSHAGNANGVNTCASRETKGERHGDLFVFVYLSIYLYIFLSIYLSVCLSVYLSIWLCIYLSTDLYNFDNLFR